MPFWTRQTRNSVCQCPLGSYVPRQLCTSPPSRPQTYLVTWELDSLLAASRSLLQGQEMTPSDSFGTQWWQGSTWLLKPGSPPPSLLDLGMASAWFLPPPAQMHPWLSPTSGCHGPGHMHSQPDVGRTWEAVMGWGTPRLSSDLSLTHHPWLGRHFSAIVILNQANLSPRYPQEPESVTKAENKGGASRTPPADAQGAKNTVYTQASPSPKALRGLLERLAGTQDLLVPVSRCGPGSWPPSLSLSTLPPPRVTWMSQAPSIVPHPSAWPFLCFSEGTPSTFQAQTSYFSVLGYSLGQ